MKTFDCMASPLEGTHLLEASAGTGKTYTIADLYLRLVAEKGLAVDRILVVTFTVAATEELRDRLRQRLRAALDEAERVMPGGKKKKAGDPVLLRRLRRALADFDRASVYTIHGFCQRALLENAFESGSLFDTKLVTDPAPLVHQAVEDFWRGRFYGGSRILLSFVLRRIKLPRLYALAATAAKSPGLELLPESVEADEGLLEEIVGCTVSRYAAAAALWKDEAGAIREEYAAWVESGALGGVHQAKHVGSRLEKVHAYLSGADPFSECEQLKFFTIGSLQTGSKGKPCPAERSFYTLCGDLWNDLEELERRFGRYELKVKRECVDFVLRETESRREAMNERTFNDLLTAMHRALEGPSGQELRRAARTKFPAALIDEFQDTDSLQYGIFRSLFDYPGGLMYLVGDPKQSIYRFRGADIYTYMDAALSVGTSATLGTNWRSVPELVGAVNAIFGPLKNPFVFDDGLIGFHEVEPADRDAERMESEQLDPAPMQIWFMGKEHIPEGQKNISTGRAEELIAGAVAGEIERIVALGSRGKAVIKGKAGVKERGVTPGDVAVLVRRHDQADLMRRELQRLGVPAVVYGTESVFFTPEAGELERVLRAAADFGSDRNIKSALATDIFGCTAADIDRMSRDGARWEQAVLRFARYRELWTGRGFIAMFRRMLTDEDIHARMLPLPDGERRMTNLLHLAELLHRHDSGARPSHEGLLRWFADSITGAGDSDETQIRLETDDDAVKLMTLHGSKGLQFPVVFCPFLHRSVRVGNSDFMFHRDGGPALDMGSDEAGEHKRQAMVEELAESVRLFYVGITRAKCRCYIAWGLINQSGTSAPAWVFHQPALEPGDDPVARLGDHMKNRGEEGMLADLAALEKRSHETIRVSALPGPGAAGGFAGRGKKAKALSCAEFTGTIDTGWSIASYSSLNAPTGRDDGADRDPAGAPVAAGGHDDIAGLPAGTGAGSCLHEILEKTEFTAMEAPGALIRDALHRYGIDTRLEGAVAGMVRRVMTAELDDSGLALGKIAAGDRIAEMEFYYPLAGITPRGLERALGRGEATIPAGWPAEGLEFSPRRGFMHGFIDLVFRWRGRYYIADWKSNRIGETADRYDAGAMEREMAAHNYHLQYHIYAVALHRYLKSRIGGYRYDRHFGGVYYLFLRGIDPGTAGQGIYFRRPGGALVERLSDYFMKGEG